MDMSAQNRNTDVANFAGYIQELKSIIADIAELNDDTFLRTVKQKVLNGGAANALNRLISIDTRRQAGIFFTSNQLAAKVASRLKTKAREKVKVLDPACGAGNLLVACAEYLPRGKTLQETLSIWGDRILGYDLHEEFITAAKLRLALLATMYHVNEKKVLAEIEFCNLFRLIKVKDAMNSIEAKQDIYTVINPPFGSVIAPKGCNWATGKVQSAALFYESLMKKAVEGQRIIALLPDVLRSGTRYRRWRNKIDLMCANASIELVGRFDEKTDVDVFILDVIKGKNEHCTVKWSNEFSGTNVLATIGDLSDVMVGPVVPHRDALIGNSYPYIHARTAPAWKVIDHISEQRNYFGRVFKPPFIVVHRTSSPSDKHRCVATVINETSEVAVENHLIVLLPHDKTLNGCLRLLEVLRSSATNEWLNARMRCRHLTVTAIRQLPFLLNDNAGE